MTSLPEPAEAARLTRFLAEHPWWSAFWDKEHAVWRAAEDDPDSGLYAASADADTVIRYMTAHSCTDDDTPAPASSSTVSYLRSALQHPKLQTKTREMGPKERSGEGSPRTGGSGRRPPEAMQLR